MVTDDQLKSHIAGNLDQLLGERDLTQSDLARIIQEKDEDLQAARMRAHRYVHGLVTPEPYRLANLCEKLGVSLDWITAPRGGRKSRNTG